MRTPMHRRHAADWDCEPLGLEALEPRQVLSADLSILGVGFKPGLPVRQGQELRVLVDVANVGDRATDRFVIEGRLSADRVWGNADDVVIKSERTQVGMQPGLVRFQTEVRVPRTLPKGRYFLGVRADTSNEVAEADERNNTFWMRGVRVLGSVRAVVLGRGRVIADTPTVPSTDNNTDFGTADLDAPGIERVFRVRNTGNDPMRIESMKIAGFDGTSFQFVGSLPSEIAPKSGANVRVRFDPQYLRLGSHHQAEVVIRSNDPTSPYRFNILGRATAAEVRSTFSIEAGGVALEDHAIQTVNMGETPLGGPTAEMEFKFTNTGNTLLRVPTPQIELLFSPDDQSHFVVLSAPTGVLRPGQSRTFNIGLRSERIGTHGTELRFDVRREDGTTAGLFWCYLRGSVVMPG